MRKIVLDTNCLLMSLPRISPYRKIWDDFLKGKLTLCVTNEIIEEYLEIIEQKTNAIIASNVVSVILSQKNVEFITPYYKLHLIQADEDDNKFVDVTALRCSEPLRSKVGGPSKVSPGFAGWDRRGNSSL